MRILIAPDKFKGSLGAAEAGTRIAAGLRATLPEAELCIVPMADGGEGTADVLRAARGGEWRECEVQDALARPCRARYAWIAPERRAVLEMAAAAGLAGLAPNERDPRRASTFGVGQMLRAAAAAGADEIIVGLGGSATNDGGFGMARALGYRFLDRTGAEIGASVPELRRLAAIVAPNEFALPAITAASDVANPLLGPEGATATFGGQKGVRPEDAAIFEEALLHFADLAAQTLGIDHRAAPGAGAAGGLGFGLLTFAQARLRPGFELVAETVGLRAQMEWADLAVTGEGRLDEQTLAGKAPAGVARLAHSLGKRVVAIVGEAVETPAVRTLFDEILTLNCALSESARPLEARAAQLGRQLRAG